MEYKTIKNTAVAELIEKKSRFIASVAPVADEEQALCFIASVKELHKSARHNIYAYILDDVLRRCSDDGEPQGTAGLPALEVLSREGLSKTAVVVTRYFGGILLGAPGLVRAYSRSVKLAVDAAGVAVMREHAVYRLSCSYSLYQKLLYLLPSFEGEAGETAYSEKIEFEVTLPNQNAKAFEKAVTELTAGEVFPVWVKNIYL